MPFFFYMYLSLYKRFACHMMKQCKRCAHDEFVYRERCPSYFEAVANRQNKKQNMLTSLLTHSQLLSEVGFLGFFNIRSIDVWIPIIYFDCVVQQTLAYSWFLHCWWNNTSLKLCHFCFLKLRRISSIIKFLTDDATTPITSCVHFGLNYCITL